MSSPDSGEAESGLKGTSGCHPDPYQFPEENEVAPTTSSWQRPTAVAWSQVVSKRDPYGWIAPCEERARARAERELRGNSARDERSSKSETHRNLNLDVDSRSCEKGPRNVQRLRPRTVETEISPRTKGSPSDFRLLSSRQGHTRAPTAADSSIATNTSPRRSPGVPPPPEAQRRQSSAKYVAPESPPDRSHLDGSEHSSTLEFDAETCLNSSDVLCDLFDSPTGVDTACGTPRTLRGVDEQQVAFEDWAQSANLFG